MMHISDRGYRSRIIDDALYAPPGKSWNLCCHVHVHWLFLCTSGEMSSTVMANSSLLLRRKSHLPANTTPYRVDTRSVAP
jgi:hypothetical protein